MRSHLMDRRPALLRWTRYLNPGISTHIARNKENYFMVAVLITILSPFYNFIYLQVGVLMALAVAREGKQPTSLFGNLPGGEQLTL